MTVLQTTGTAPKLPRAELVATWEADDDLRADLDQLFLQARQRPIPYGLRRRQGSQKVAEIVGQRMKLKADGVGGE